MVKIKTKPFDTNLTDAEFRSRIISALRQASRWWKPKSEALTRARVGRGKYKCESCGKIGPLKLPPEEGKKRKRNNAQADHKKPIVPVTGFTTYDNWIERCFVGVDEFDVLCWNCHSKKTKEENIKRREWKKLKKAK